MEEDYSLFAIFKGCTKKCFLELVAPPDVAEPRHARNCPNRNKSFDYLLKHLTKHN